MKTFQEMNRARLGIVGVGAVVVVLAILLNINTFPALTGKTVYTAFFANSGGLASGDDVRMGGVDIGAVKSIGLDGDKVAVTFTVNPGSAHLGSATSAAVKTQTVLGQMYLQVTSAGPGTLNTASAIPVSRTTTPYDLTSDLGQLAATAGQINTKQLAQALDSVSDDFAGAPSQTRSALTGLGRLSQIVASRDAQIQDLLRHADGVTGVLADRNQQMVKLVLDGNSLLEELQAQQQAIHVLLVNVQAAAEQLRGLVKDNQGQLGPALAHFNSVLNVLRRNQGNIAAAIQQLAPFADSLGEAVASGPYWDANIGNLIPGNLVPPGVGGITLPSGAKK
jgi:phospholipid/cholesterol/gamma-HCH transport system substrate-binding protein